MTHSLCSFCGEQIEAQQPDDEGRSECPRCGQAIATSAPAGSLWRMVGNVGVVAFVCAIALVYFLPAVVPNTELNRRQPCLNNLHRIALAMHNYAQHYSCLPPAYVADKHGRPMHSWRILILPFMDEPSLKSLYDRYRFDEPWDSPHNKEVTNVAIGLYQCPSQPDLKEPTTSYMMVVGEHAFSNGPHGRKFTEIKDGLSNTIMLVEVADSSTWWAEPVDLEFDKMSFKLNSSKRQGISSYHSGGANVAQCDGAVRFLPDSTNPELIKAMITIDGAERVSDDRDPPSHR